jgi:hypothetical protein
MGNLNSSGAQDRFLLASGGSRTWLTAQGGNLFDCDVKGDDQSAASVTVKLQTSEDNISFSDVSTVTVVPSGYALLNGAVGKYGRILSSSGSDEVLVVAKLRNIAQVVPSL